MARAAYFNAQGTLLIYDAGGSSFPLPVGESQGEGSWPPSSLSEGAGAFIAYWHDYGTSRVYFYEHLLTNQKQLREAIVSLEETFAPGLADLSQLSSSSRRGRGVRGEGPQKSDREDLTRTGMWREATAEALYALMRLPGEPPAFGPVGVVAADCSPWGCEELQSPGEMPGAEGMSTPAGPGPDASYEDFVSGALMAINCCGGGGGDPLPECRYPCCCCNPRLDAAAKLGQVDGVVIAAAGCCVSSCDDGNFCTLDDRCGGHPPNFPCGALECCGILKSCDDGNSCTYDGCMPASGLCVHTCSSPCVPCAIGEGENAEGGWCQGCGCRAETCNMRLSSAAGQACETVEMILEPDCEPDCGSAMWFGVDVQYPPGHEEVEPWLSVYAPIGVYCDHEGEPVSVPVRIHVDAPVGPVDVVLYAVTDLEAACSVTGRVIVQEPCCDPDDLCHCGTCQAGTCVPDDPICDALEVCCTDGVHVDCCLPPGEVCFHGHCCAEPDENDIDCDGIPNNQDDDIDGDGVPNDQDDDDDGDGVPDTQDPCPINPDPCCGINCYDGDLCTEDSCVNGSCVQETTDCDDGSSCTVDTCNPQTGLCEHECGAATAVAGECGLTVALKGITFSGDHPVHEDAPPCQQGTALCWGAGPALGGADWEEQNNPDHPLCYTRSTPLQMTVVVLVTGNESGVARLRVTGPDGITGEGTFSVPCGTEYRTVSITTTNLPDLVKAYTPAGLNWSVKAPGDNPFVSIGATYHRLYVTLGAPTGSEPTNRRLNTFCYAAAQAATGDAAALGIWDYLTINNPPSFGLGADCSDPWQLMAGGAGNNGECIDLALLMRYASEVIGLSASVGFVYATTDGVNFSTSVDAHETRRFEYSPGLFRDETLVYWASGGALPAGFNNWEAVCTINGHYYAVKETHNSSSVQLIKDIVCPNTLGGNYQCWLFNSGSGNVCNTVDQYPAPLPNGCP